MTPSSCEWPEQPIQVSHLVCETTWELYTPNWPPRMVICPQCHIPLKLVGHDPVTKALSFRHI